jgi:MFS family permease
MSGDLVDEFYKPLVQPLGNRKPQNRAVAALGAALFASFLGVAVFTAASIACGLSPNIAVLIVSRAVQGFGGSTTPGTRPGAIASLL